MSCWDAGGRFGLLCLGLRVCFVIVMFVFVGFKRADCRIT